MRSITPLNETVSATTLSPASPSIAVSRRSNGSTTIAPTSKPTTAGASDGVPQIANASAGRRKALSDRPGITSRPFHTFEHAASRTTPSTATEAGRSGCRASTSTAEPAITATLRRPVVMRPEATDRRCSRNPRGPAGTRSSTRPAPNTSRRPPSAPHPAAPTSSIVARTRVHTAASIASATPRTRGTSTPRWFSTRSRPHLIARSPSASPQHPRQDGLRDVPTLPAPVEEATEVPVRRAVLQAVDRNLEHAQARPNGVDRHRGLDPETLRERPNGLHRSGREGALAGQRLERSEPAPAPDQMGGRALDETEPSRGRRWQDGDREVGPVGAHDLDQPNQTRGGGAEIPVRQQPHVGRLEAPEGTLQGSALAASAARPQDRRPGPRGLGAGGIGRAIIHDDHLVDERQQRRDAGPDPPGLVARRDERDDTSAHGSGGSGSAPPLTPEAPP